MNINFYPIFEEFEPLLKLYPPVKASEFLPEWYKKQANYKRIDYKFGPSIPNAKICPAIRYDLTEGIILPAWSDVIIEYNKQDTNWVCSVGSVNFLDQRIREFPFLSNHSYNQTEGMDLNIGGYGALKLSSPYYMSTEPGVHTKFTDVTHHIRRDVRFLSATVETDIWHEVNFPFEFINPPTDETKKILIKAGDPLVMLTPIKAQKTKPTITLHKYNQKFVDDFRVHELQQRSVSLSWNKYKQYRKSISEEE